jgi:hypothetical protein
MVYDKAGKERKMDRSNGMEGCIREEAATINDVDPQCHVISKDIFKSRDCASRDITAVPPPLKAESAGCLTPHMIGALASRSAGITPTPYFHH